MDIESISKDDFAAYEDVRGSGIANMRSSNVEILAGISKEVKLAIMKHYAALCAKWPDIRNLES